jgi:hypothetical protein
MGAMAIHPPHRQTRKFRRELLAFNLKDALLGIKFNLAAD